MLAASVPFYLRSFGEHDREADYELLLTLANAQVPQDPRGNAEWLEHRRAYDERRGERRHYIAVHRPTNEPIAYAALEQQQADPSSFRIYLAHVQEPCFAGILAPTAQFVEGRRRRWRRPE
jgi:hypothetical protein